MIFLLLLLVLKSVSVILKISHIKYCNIVGHLTFLVICHNLYKILIKFTNLLSILNMLIFYQLLLHKLISLLILTSWFNFFILLLG